MHCDTDTADLHQFEVYAGWQKNADFGLGYNVVMKLCKYISGKIIMSIVKPVYICPVMEGLAGL